MGPAHLIAAGLESAGELLEKFGWELDRLRASLPTLPGDGKTAEADQALQHASNLSVKDCPGLECAEQLLLELLHSAPPVLDDVVPTKVRERATALLRQRLLAGEEWTRLGEQFHLDQSAGTHLLAILGHPESLAVRVLREVGVNLDEVARAARQDQKKFEPSFSGVYNFVPVRPRHLLYGASRRVEVVRWAESLGVVPFRLESVMDRHWLGASRGDYRQERFPWVRPACEEAARLGGGAVSEHDLLLGLLADEENVACHVLRRSGYELRALRAKLEARSTEGEGFTEGARLVLERAAQMAGGLQPRDGPMLAAIATVMELRLSTPRVDPGGRIRVEGLCLGMTPDEVIAALGEPQQQDAESRTLSAAPSRAGVESRSARDHPQGPGPPQHPEHPHLRRRGRRNGQTRPTRVQAPTEMRSPILPRSGLVQEAFDARSPSTSPAPARKS